MFLKVSLMSGCSHLQEADRLLRGDKAGGGLNRASPKALVFKGLFCSVAPWQVVEALEERPNWGLRSLEVCPGEIVLVSSLVIFTRGLLQKPPSLASPSILLFLLETCPLGSVCVPSNAHCYEILIGPEPVQAPCP